MIKNIIFDMGQVLIKFDPDVFLERVGINDPADKALLNREVYKSLEWARMDRGSLTDAQAADIMCTRIPARLHDAVRKLTVEWDRPILPVRGMEELVRELKKNGYKIYLLSNASLRQKDYWQNIPAWECFDGRIVSSEEGLVKPQPEIYRLILDRYGLNAAECVFIDDATFNCEGAYYCGIHPIVFHGDAEEVREKLAALGVNVSL